MSRQEEIVNTANKYYKGDEVSTFVVVAQWADNTMIEKAVKYLEVNFPDIENVGIGYKESFINNFRKAMKN